MKRFYILFLVMLTAICSHAQISIAISPNKTGPEIGPLHYGIFFEEINHAGDGGLYAELIANRSFEDSYVPERWTSSNGAEMNITTDNLLNDIQRQALFVDMVDGGVVQNYGFWGMKFVKGEKYKFSAFIMSDSYSGPLTAKLIDNNGNTIGSEDIEIIPEEEWVKVSATITATGDASRGSFVLMGNDAGSFLIDVVSLFPPTFKDRENGCRPDLAQMLADMKPAFMRFPGGCFIEGEYQNGSQNRFEWKKTIGPIEQRPGHQNVNWRYRVSDGLGFHEMLQLSEDLGAAPLFVVNIGMGHGWTQPVNDLDEYIQEALDALEYANGDITTTYGAMRAANGHPQPFNLKLIEIGNENYQANEREQSWQYAERYNIFYEAIKSKYPDVTCIGNVESWGTDNPTWRNNYPVDAVDEHYYRDPKWFENAYEKYDGYNRKTMQKVYAGEYAVTSDFGTTGNLSAALGEAVYMLGMENNSDMCVMSSYAPIFTHESDFNWKPDMIRFNASESYGTPSYYVQKMLPNNVGTTNVEFSEKDNTYEESYDKYVGLSTWLTAANFSNYKVTLEDGTVIKPSFDGNSGWKSQGGTWIESDGTLSQTNTSMEGLMYYAPSILTGDNYTIEVDAVKTEGKEGFLIAFNIKDSDNYSWWNLGGWGNTKHAVEICTNGIKSTVTSSYGYLENDVTYHLKIEVKGNKVKCYINDELAHAFATPTPRKVYISSNVNEDKSKLYLKLVNTTKNYHSAMINLKDYFTTGGTLKLLASASDKDENTNDNHYNVVPTEEAMNVQGSSFTFNVRPYSLNILELNIEEGTSQNGVYIEPQKCYIYNKEKDVYLSRGKDWGTRATFDKYGLPVEIAKASPDGYTIRYIDSNAAKSYLGKDGLPYTDKNLSYPVRWNFVNNDEGDMVLQNADTKEYLIAGENIGDGASLTSDISKATTISLVLGAAQAARIKEQKDAITNLYEACFATDITIKVKNPDMSVSKEGWTIDFSKQITSNNGLTEIYEGYGTISQTITGLKPNTTYRLSIPALTRAGFADIMNPLAEEGIVISNAYIFAGSEQSQIKPWVMDRTYPSMPSSMAEASQCISKGLYKNYVIGTSDANGNLTIGICQPHKSDGCWTIWGQATLEEVVTPENYTAYIVNPSFESNLTGWVTNMKTQSNNESSAMKSGNLYCESWTLAPAHLWDVYTQQTISNLPDGRYRIIAACHAENQSTKEAIVGAYLFANDVTTLVGGTKEYDVLVDVIGGTLTLGFKTEDTNANWVTVDNFRLIYLGENDSNDSGLVDAYKELRDKEVKKLTTLLKKKTILTEELRNEGYAAISSASEAETVEMLKQAIEDVKACYAKLDAYRINVEYKDPYTSYIFAYFPSNYDENLYIAHSMDGFEYTPLNNGNRVMLSDTVAIKKGIRDPHILRGVDGKTFYMVATDMKSAEGWSSNRGIVMYRSTDLVHWQHATVHFPERFPEKWRNVTRVWAPEVIWNPDYKNSDGTMGRYMVYFSLLTNDGTCTYDKVFYCHANDDFTDLIEEPIFLYDRGSATIDADIIYDESDQKYHMIYKNEGSGGICHITAYTLTAPEGEEPGSQWGTASGTIQQTNVAVEGGGLFRLINSSKWVVMYDCYNSGYYQFCTTEDWTKYTFVKNTYTSGAFTPRHGTVLPITTAEAKRLLKAFPTNDYNPSFPSLLGDANEDGKVSMEDANIVVNYTRGIVPETFNTANADANKDTKIDMKDAKEIVNIYLK